MILFDYILDSCGLKTEFNHCKVFVLLETDQDYIGILNAKYSSIRTRWGIFMYSKLAILIVTIQTLLNSYRSFSSEIWQCSYPDYPQEVFSTGREDAERYLSEGYSCHIHQEMEEIGRGHSGILATYSLYQRCIELIQSADGIMSPEVVRCSHLVAPELKKGQPLTSENAEKLKSIIPAHWIDLETRLSDSYRSGASLSEVPSCIKVREEMFKVLQGLSDGDLNSLKSLGYNARLGIRNLSPSEDDALKKQIFDLTGLVTKVERCSLGMSRRSLGQTSSLSTKARSTSSIKSTGSYDFTADLLVEAQRVSQGRSGIAHLAE